ncbi:MAG: Cyclopentanol dehydrogenase [Alphaproteobacteria bacterium MarineAlpha9_Bin4]|nr:MAG: Cyclopentanol dehydrogenase [Alphaproteobacteria bacterium MarineAlpha9_Bin4]|tara:strand:- start:440 stop:1147 length:708 start_codon:yes stop_codon:yes gene_type:complete
MNIENKKIILFGGTSGIGLSTTIMLSKMGAKKIYAISRNPEKSNLSYTNVELVKTDVLNENDLLAFFKKIGKYDVLINAATGGERAIGPFMNMDLVGYRNSFKKLWGYTNTVRLGLKQLNKNGCIVLVSGSPARKCKAGQIALASVGGAVEAFSRSLAAEIKPIRINIVSPGIIDTPMIQLEGKERDDFYRNVTKENLIPRPGKAEEVTQAIIFAIQNDFITGTTIDVDGGWLNS